MTKENKMLFLIHKRFFWLYLTLCYISLGQVSYAQSEKIQKVVIDAGHGGKDSGTAHGGVKEKDINLAVALKLGKLINKHHPTVQVIYTRDKDIFVDLDVRADVANKNHADLFISIHVNGVDGAPSASGSETFVMGVNRTSANMAVAQRENSVIMYEDDYSTKYEGFDPKSPESYIIFSLMQNVYLEQSLHLASFVQEEFGSNPIKVNRGVKQAGFLVLYKTATPSILIELGFLSNNMDRSILNSDNHQDHMANSILNAFTRYKNMCEKTNISLNNYTTTQATKETIDTSKQATLISSITTTSTTDTDSKEKKMVYYRIQIMSIDKNEPLSSKIFKGYKEIHSIKSGNIYKYTLGNYTQKLDATDACKRVQKDFPGAFIVAVQDGKIIPMK